ncbi:MAG: thermonuclease family protein [Candidatus Poribacteria bacterium]|nr:thermonuclease family protein [Candidatus Poribacteria bacterium]
MKKREHILLKGLIFGAIVAIIGTLIIVLVSAIYGQEPPIYIATIENAEQVYDGDTIRDARIIIYQFHADKRGEVWPGVFIYDDRIEIETDIRIAGIDTPERRPSTKNADGTPRSEASREKEKAAALAARQAIMDLLLSNSLIMNITAPEHGKYAGRIVARVSVNGTDIGAYLLDEGHAKVYDGGKKVPYDEW